MEIRVYLWKYVSIYGKMGLFMKISVCLWKYVPIYGHVCLVMNEIV